VARDKLQLRGLVVDWAGTIVDHGSRAPVAAFQEIFRRREVEVTAAEARGPMGMEKRDHIATMLSVPRIAEAWRAVHGGAATDADIDALYHSFLPIQMELLGQHADIVPGAIEALAECRARGLKLGSSSGYAAPLMERLAALAKQNGLEVDAVVSASEVPAGRPAPWMIFRNMQLLNACPPAAVVAIDDTTVGVEAGLNAGTWTVGVIETGNMLGVSAEELARLPAAERERRREAGRQTMLEAGAHYAIASVAEIVPVLDEIDRRLAAGERP
jgi:phosphonoacetaldehyde hydrolase